MSSPLKHCLVDHPEPAYRVAQRMAKSDVWLSKVTRGLIEPSEFEKQQLSNILGRSVGELFPVGPLEAA